MKTTTVEVPHFEGYECIGLANPSEENFVLRFSESIKEFTLMEGSEDYCHQICYKKIKNPKEDNRVYYLVYFALEDGETRFDFSLFESKEEAEEYAESEMEKDDEIFKPVIVPVSVR